MVTLEEMKQYLRIDYDDDDSLICDLIVSAKKTCMDIARVDAEDDLAQIENAKIAVMFAVAYMYEHREEANHNSMNLTLRALLFSAHEGGF